MLSMFTKVRVVLFVLLAVVVLAYTGIRYANAGRFFGAPGYYVVNVDLADGGGLYPDADVTYRGVTVGRVGAMTLTGSGVRAELDISDSAPRIPANARAVVADLSALGEQYLDLRPERDSGPYLTANDVIAQPDTQIPQPVTTLLTNVDALARSLPAGSLRTVVNELYQAFNGQGPNLRTLLDASGSFTSAASNDITPTSKLIDEGQGVLATQQAETSAIESFAASAQLLAQQLDDSDSDLRRLITVTPQAAQQVIGLLQDNDPDLGLTLANLLTTSDVALTRQPALKELLSVLPAVVAAGNTVITKNSASFGLTLTFFNPSPCTDGYQGTIYRNGLDTSPAPPLNTAAHCASPPRTGIDVRGSANAPSGGGVPPAAKP
jgi:phospholipid/cholesterol/gamma-HCH transport system substrate-binding protein